MNSKKLVYAILAAAVAIALVVLLVKIVSGAFGLLSGAVNAVLGILDMRPCPMSPEIDRLIRKREAARSRKDWAEADAVRDELLRMGVNVVDTAAGPVWERASRDCGACEAGDGGCACGVEARGEARRAEK